MNAAEMMTYIIWGDTEGWVDPQERRMSEESHQITSIVRDKHGNPIK